MNADLLLQQQQQQQQQQQRSSSFDPTTVNIHHPYYDRDPHHLDRPWPLLRGTADDPQMQIVSSRMLGTDRRHGDGTLAVLMIVCALFCFVWAPVMLRRCRGTIHRGRQEDDVRELERFEVEARAMRATLQRMSAMGNVAGAFSASEFVRGSAAATTSNSSHQHELLEIRREFLDNALLTKKVIFQEENDQQNVERELAGGKETNNNNEKKDVENETADNDEEKKRKRQQQKSDLIVMVHSTKLCKSTITTTKAPAAAAADNETGTNNDNDDKEGLPKKRLQPETLLEDSPQEQQQQQQQQQQDDGDDDDDDDDDGQLEPCPICLTDYDDGDDICWSQNDKCNHFFHKTCIQTWLLTHDECPCCRQDFLFLWGDEDDNNNNDIGETSNHRTRGTEGRFAVAAAATANRSSSNRTWVDELADEIQERILQRQQQLQYELYQREQQERQRHFLIALAELQQEPQPPSTPSSITNNNPQQQEPSEQQQQQQQHGFGSVRNSATSANEMAAGFLLYRHFPFPIHFTANPGTTTAAPAGAGQRRNDGNGPSSSRNHHDDEDEDVEVAQFGMPLGLDAWHTYRPDYPVVMTSPGSSLFEMVERSSRRLGGGGEDPLSQARPRQHRFLSAGREASSRRLPPNHPLLSFRRSSSDFVSTARSSRTDENRRRVGRISTRSEIRRSRESPSRSNDENTRPTDGEEAEA